MIDGFQPTVTPGKYLAEGVRGGPNQQKLHNMRTGIRLARNTRNR